MSQRRFDDFNRHASDYRDVHTKNIRISGADSFYFAEFKVKEIMRFEENRKSYCLDLGCGDGTTEVFIDKHFPAVTVEAVDVSQASILEAEKKKLKRASFTVYDGETIPFEDNCFDMVLIASVMHHIAFNLHESLIKETLRVLKPGGRIYIFEHNPLNPFTRYLVKTCAFDRDARLLSHGYCKRLLTGAGYREVNTHFLLFFPRMKWIAPLLRREQSLGWLPLGAQYLCRAIK